MGFALYLSNLHLVLQAVGWSRLCSRLDGQQTHGAVPPTGCDPELTCKYPRTVHKGRGDVVCFQSQRRA